MDPLVDVRKIFDSVAEIWVLVDDKGRVLLTSKHVDRFKDLIQPALVPGASIFDSITESWKKLSENILNTLRYAGVPSTLEASYADAEGKETHFEITCTAVRGQGADVEQIFIEARDVTPQKIFERKITIVAREYQSVIENANAVIIGTDARGYITEWNAMTTQVTGYSKNESYIQKLSDFLPEASQEAFSFAMNKVLMGDVVTNYEMNTRGKGGREIMLLINATPRTSANG